VNRREIEARARAEALVRDELARERSLRAEVADLAPRAGLWRRLAAALAGSRPWALLAGDRRIGRGGDSEVARQGAELRRRRFRLARRRRALEAGASEPLRAAAARIRPSRTDGKVDDDALWQERWGPAIRQRVLAELLAGGGEDGARAARALVAPECPPEAEEAIAELGLERVGAGAEADVTIALDRAGELSFDWIGAGERGVASIAGLAERLAAGGGAPALAEALRASARAPSFCIRIASRDWEAANSGGDAALARSLARALGERGHQALLQVDAEAGDPVANSLDVLLVLRGRRAGEPTPGRINLLWQISHPEEAEAAELDRYDRVLVASTQRAEELRGEVRPPVEPLLQFTDPALFHPVTPAEPLRDVVFVGNWRGEFRRIVWDALQAGHPPALYGRGWDLLAPEHAVAEHVPHAELARLYASCKVLLCDHWEDMRRHGFLANRIFDALACGAFVIADDNPALAEVLPGAVETYSTPAELGAKIERYLGDPAERERIARRGREMALADHTVERRAEQLLAIASATARACRRPETARLRERGGPAGGASAAAAAQRGTGAESA
jgi:Glycosyl transferases group 1